MTDFTSSQDSSQEVPYGYCHCGCGQKTKIASRTDVTTDRIKGLPMRFVHGHNRRRSKAECFWECVTPGPADQCWLWQGVLDSNRYGRLSCGGLAHRLSYELHFGSFSDGLFVCHHCDNPQCVNPAHLFLGTPADNTHDMLAKGRQSCGERHNASLTTSIVREMRSLYASGVSPAEIARRFNASYSSTYGVIRRTSWKHVE